MMESLANFISSTGFAVLLEQAPIDIIKTVVMIVIACVLIYLAIVKQYEPLLLLPIAFGMLVTNLPMMPEQLVMHADRFVDPNVPNSFVDQDKHIMIQEVVSSGGLLDLLYLGVKLGIYPPLIFLGIGAMTDFAPLIANPKSILLGAAAQLGVFAAFFMALMLSATIPGINFNTLDASSIGIIGGADGPTAIFVTKTLAPHLLPAIAVAAYS